jgi:DNA replication and repair protein RecF
VYLQRLEIQHFRNLTHVSVDLSPGLNFFFGPNGAGKTALLESVFLLGRGRSFRTQQVRELIQLGEDAVLVRGDLVGSRRGDVSAGVRRTRSGEVELRVAGQRRQKLSELAELMALQALLPDVGDLVFGAPSHRRSWIDWGVFHVEHAHLDRIRQYRRVLKQRGRLLRESPPSPDALAPWNHELAKLAAEVTASREGYLRALLPHFQGVLSALSPSMAVEWEYRAGWPADQPLEKLLGERGQGEVKLEPTPWGSHRAELALFVKGAGRVPAGKTLSRGQGKILATALRLAQATHLRSERRLGTMFLIDDVGAELDAEHSARLFEVLRHTGCQILATSADRPAGAHGFSDDAFAVFHVEHGSVRPETLDV